MLTLILSEIGIHNEKSSYFDFVCVFNAGLGV